MGIIVPIHKIGNIEENGNYGGITLLRVVAKLYERLLNARLREKRE